MLAKFNIQPVCNAIVVPGGANKGGLITNWEPKGFWTIQHFRKGKLYNEYRFPNMVTTEGKDMALDVVFNDATKITEWYILLIDNAGYTALNVGDTYDEIDQSGNGWQEFTDYEDPANGGSSTSRPVWVTGAASSGAVSNASPAVFDITGSGTIRGAAIVGGGTNSSVKGDHAPDGTLWCTALFQQGNAPVNASDQLKVTYGTIS